MSKLSKEEIAARRKRMQDEAMRSVAKTEQLNIRIDEDSVTRLYTLAGEQGKPVGTMVREWILERIKSEEQPSGPDQLKMLIDLVSGVHTKIDRWDSIQIEQQVAMVTQEASDTMRAKAEIDYLRLAS